MAISHAEYLEMQARLAENRRASRERCPFPTPAEREVGHGGLQEQIRDWCDKQWPKWKVIQARPDKRSTIPVGAHDMTIFAPLSRVITIEVKAKGNKPSKEQLSWACELNAIGHTVHFVYSMEQFLEIARTTA